MSASEPPRPKEDVLFVHSPAEAGEGYRVIRKREDVLEVGEIRPVQEGKPIHGDLVKLKPRKEHERFFDVEVLASREEMGGKASLGHHGPAQVATEAYRSNWDSIFGGGFEGGSSDDGEPELPN
jgi:hypothetical protein